MIDAVYPVDDVEPRVVGDRGDALRTSPVAVARAFGSYSGPGRNARTPHDSPNRLHPSRGQIKASKKLGAVQSEEPIRPVGEQEGRETASGADDSRACGGS